MKRGLYLPSFPGLTIMIWIILLIWFWNISSQILRIKPNYKVLRKCEYKTFKDSTNNINKVATPRVPFLIKNRSSIKDWFTKHNIELGTWFDGPLSPLPTKSIFNYSGESFSQSILLSQHIVNIPCHSRMGKKDLEHVELLLSKYVAMNPVSKI